MWQSTVYDVVVTMGSFLFVMIPGMLIATALFKNKVLLWRLAVGNVLSFLLLGWGILVLNFLEINIGYVSIVVTSLIYIAIASLFLWQSGSVQRSGNFSAIVSRLKKTLGFPALILLLFITTVIVILPMAQAHNKVGFTEFYLAEGMEPMPPWREKYGVDEAVTITAVIANNENSSQSYTMHVVTKENVLQIVELGLLQPGDTVKQQIILPPRNAMEQQFQILLFKGDSQEPYRILSFWLHA
ncbi:MAG: DUF1616 domain-containing protein [Chloroflexi bacterium]|nr:MAG: DUF1616 domain-containing protein [Chloroflexota bacterium]